MKEVALLQELQKKFERFSDRLADEQKDKVYFLISLANSHFDKSFSHSLQVAEQNKPKVETLKLSKTVRAAIFEAENRITIDEI